MSDLHFAVYSAVLFVALFLGWRSVSKHSAQAPLPPGPRLLPFVGNAFDIDVSKPWLTYANWKEKYGMRLTPSSTTITATNTDTTPGDLVYSRVLGQHFIIISSMKVARDLLDKRSAIYSNRPVLRAYEEYVR
jgi:hypothetical protein